MILLKSLVSKSSFCSFSKELFGMFTMIWKLTNKLYAEFLKCNISSKFALQPFLASPLAR